MKRKVDIKHLQLSVGHSDMKTTLGYTHLVGADSSWVNDLYDFDDHPVVNTGEKTAPKVIDVESENVTDNGNIVGTSLFDALSDDPFLQCIVAFRAKNKKSGWRDSNPRPSGPKPDALPDCATPRADQS